MKNNWGILILLLVSLSSFSQEFINKKFESKELRSTRDLKIYLPEGYQKDSINNYPLAIIIDGEHLFDTYVASSKLFSMTDKAPKQIVVGIQINKTREEDTYFDENTYQLTGGNVKFLRFIKNEILPFMEGSYRTSPFISIIGQGSSVNLVTQFLNEKPPIFNAYIAINPLFAPNITAKTMSFQVDKFEKEDNTFYLYINDAPFFSKEKKKPLPELKTYLSSISAKNFHFKYDEMNSESYISSLGEAIPRAMDKIFETYGSITTKEFEEKIKALEPSDAIAYLENKYLDIDFLFGSNLGIREKDIFIIEDVIIDKEDGDYLRNFGEMILNVYPRSHIGDYYVGLYFEKKGKMSLALESYRSGYDKMSNSDPNKSLFYTNIERVSGR
ncbi:hypothetical protein LPB136_02295 [Tenacibaculum todarodis]|uniref:Esterase n=1 Tax=Tenacibaculum todarodis TaxID=1850252 RepID=A0A1L3JGM1_9FLAO|nr:alpha/beta hydrolase-fold protein [Tenacibaculum todarodis]APG64269.1 hypothetical protein LPB136_02295 [Tenacibaculum todarodis]